MEKKGTDGMKVLIVGSGSIGSRHKRNLQQMGIDRIAWVSPQRFAEDSATEMQEKRYFSFADSLSFSPDAVFVCNPTSLHFEAAAFYLKNNIPVYLEKPVAARLEEAEALEKIAKETGTFCMVGYQYRFHPTLKAAKEMIDRGELGDILSVHCEVGEYLPDFHPYEDYRISYAARSDLGGGVLLTLSHEIDYLCWLFGAIARVSCTGGKKSDLEIDVEDSASLSMQTISGIPLFLNMDYLRKPPVRTLEVRGSDKTLFWNYYGALRIKAVGADTATEIELPEAWERNDLFLESITHFIHGLRGGMESKIPISEGKAVVKIVEAAKRSMEKASPVVL